MISPKRNSDFVSEYIMVWFIIRKTRSVIFTIASKEFSDIVKGKRFLILAAIFVLLVIVDQATVYISISSTQGALHRSFLGSAAHSLVTIMLYFAPIVGLALGFDAISGEREKGYFKNCFSSANIQGHGL